MTNLGSAAAIEHEAEGQWAMGHVLSSRYRLEEELGGGSMGVVVRATDLETGEAVAIKLMRTALRNQGSLQMRFIGEAMAMRLSEGPHCVALLEVGRCEQLGPFFVMPYLQGKDLGALLVSGYQPTVATSVQLVLQACEALQQVHLQGIVHCDIKPQNLFVQDSPQGPFLQLLDFGISRSLSEFSDLKSSLGPFNKGEIHGTPHYLSPEQLEGSLELDARADIWALGAVLYELITGAEAFAGSELTEILRRVLRAATPKPLHFFPGPLAQLHAVIVRCLSRDPAARFSTVQELAAALLPFAALPNETQNSPSPLPATEISTTRPPPAAEKWTHAKLVLPNSTTTDLSQAAGRLNRSRPPPKIAVAIGLLAAGLLGAFLGFRYLRLPLPSAQAPVAHQKPTVSTAKRRSADGKLQTVRLGTVRHSLKPTRKASRVSRLPAGYRRDQRDDVPRVDQR